jgi:hypothetical protein
MNIITHANAYALYPHATFCKRVGLIIPTGGAGQDIGREKYRQRGWKLVDRITISEATSVLTESIWDNDEFTVGDRYIGDDKTWTIPLSPPVAFYKRPVKDVLPLNSWAVEYRTLDFPDMVFEVLELPRLKYTITYTRSSFRILRAISLRISQNSFMCVAPYYASYCANVLLLIT